MGKSSSTAFFSICAKTSSTYEDMIGFSVYNEDLLIGKLTDIINNGAHDILVIKSSNNDRIMVPFVDEYVKKVDLDNKKIMIETIEGLLDGNWYINIIS